VKLVGSFHRWLVEIKSSSKVKGRPIVVSGAGGQEDSPMLLGCTSVTKLLHLDVDKMIAKLDVGQRQATGSKFKKTFRCTCSMNLSCKLFKCELTSK
jgi:hypothetical protein